MDFFYCEGGNLHHRHLSAIVKWFDGFARNEGEKDRMNKKGDQKSFAPDRLAGDSSAQELVIPFFRFH